jgi:hypothetical protein
MDWLHRKIDAGGGFFLGFMYARDLWLLGSAQKIEDPAKDLRATAGLIVLYTYELIIIDGAKCGDSTAPENRLSQLFRTYAPTFAYMKTKPPELKASIVAIAIALEKKTAPLRKDDDLVCRDGFEQMKAGIAAGKEKEVSNTGGYYGRTVAVGAPPGYKPRFLAAETYKPIQEKARSEMTTSLLKLVN